MADGENGRKNGGLARIASLLIAVLLLVAGSFAIQLPLLAIAPGPAISIGDRLTIDGVGGEELDGDYLFLVIAVNQVSLVGAVAGAIDPDIDIVSRSRLIPAGVDLEEFAAEQQAIFDAATDLAVGLGLQAAGEQVDLSSTSDIELPAEVEFSGDGVGGPSAGLLTALATYDLVDDEDLAAGRRIAGTGEIDADGRVLPIGSVADKLASAITAGADVFLVPAEQEGEAIAALPAGSDLVIVGVGSIEDAIVGLREG